MIETLVNMIDIMLSWLGLTRTTHYDAAVRDLQVQRMRVYHLRLYLKGLQQDTPHDNIKKEITDVLIKNRTCFHIDLLD